MSVTDLDIAAKEINTLVGDLAGCSDYGCRCVQSLIFLQAIKKYCDAELAKHQCKLEHLSKAIS